MVVDKASRWLGHFSALPTKHQLYLSGQPLGEFLGMESADRQDWKPASRERTCQDFTQSRKLYRTWTRYLSYRLLSPSKRHAVHIGWPGQAPVAFRNGTGWLQLYTAHWSFPSIISAGVAQSVERVALTTETTSRSGVRAPPSAIPIQISQISIGLDLLLLFAAGHFSGASGRSSIRKSDECSTSSCSLPLSTSQML